MARVSLIEKEQAPDIIKEVYQKVEDNGAKVINLFKVLANSPTNILINIIRLGNSIIGKTELSPKLRELTILRVARLSGSEYEWRQHVAIALEVGVKQGQLDAISEWQDSSEFNDEECAVLQYVDEVVEKVNASDRTFNALKKFFSERVIVELTVTISYYGMLARVLVSLQVEVDKSYIGSVSELIGGKGVSDYKPFISGT